VSGVDTSFAASERLALLSEVRQYLPAFLSSAVDEHVSTLDALDDLMNLAAADLERVVAVHLALSDPIAAFVDGLRAGLRRPITESVRQRVVTQAVRGPIDWGDTIRRRAGAGNDPTLFVVRPATRLFDNPENQTVAWTLRELRRVVRRARLVETGGVQALQGDDWSTRLLRSRVELEAASRHVWLHQVAPVRPSARTLTRLRHARTRFYKELVPDAYAAIVRFAEAPTPNDITELLAQRFFEPSQDWRLFELVVALRLARAFRERTESTPHHLLVGSPSPRRPFATFSLTGGANVSVYYQGWPSGAGASSHSEARTRHNISAGATRPDISIVKRQDGVIVDAVVLELKATRSASYLGEGLSQLLGYLKERPAVFPYKPAGWLVAPTSDAFTPAAADDNELWVVSADDVASAAVERFVA
jgi:hypothetical protein